MKNVKQRKCLAKHTEIASKPNKKEKKIDLLLDKPLILCYINNRQQKNYLS